MQNSNNLKAASEFKVLIHNLNVVTCRFLFHPRAVKLFRAVSMMGMQNVENIGWQHAAKFFYRHILVEIVARATKNHGRNYTMLKTI